MTLTSLEELHDRVKTCERSLLVSLEWVRDVKQRVEAVIDAEREEVEREELHEQPKG